MIKLFAALLLVVSAASAADMRVVRTGPWERRPGKCTESVDLFICKGEGCTSRVFLCGENNSWGSFDSYTTGLVRGDSCASLPPEAPAGSICVLGKAYTDDGTVELGAGGSGCPVGAVCDAGGITFTAVTPTSLGMRCGPAPTVANDCTDPGCPTAFFPTTLYCDSAQSNKLCLAKWSTATTLDGVPLCGLGAVGGGGGEGGGGGATITGVGPGSYSVLSDYGAMGFDQNALWVGNNTAAPLCQVWKQRDTITINRIGFFSLSAEASATKGTAVTIFDLATDTKLGEYHGILNGLTGPGSLTSGSGVALAAGTMYYRCVSADGASNMATELWANHSWFTQAATSTNASSFTCSNAATGTGMFMTLAACGTKIPGGAIQPMLVGTP